jgi:uncharacterized protein
MGCRCSDPATFRRVSEVTVVPTYECFFDCTYCFVEKELAPTRKTITRKKLDRIIEFFIPRRINSPFTLWFFGGEPLLEKEVVKYGTERALEAGEDHGIPVTVGATTNAYLLDTDFIEWCLETGFRLLISYDGYQNQRIFRGRKGRREMDAGVVERNIRVLHATERGRRLAPTAALQLPPGGLDGLYQNVMSAFDLGFTSVAMNKVTGRAGGYSEEDLGILRRELGKLAQFVARERHGGGNRTIEFLEKQVGFLCDSAFLSKQAFQHDKSCGAARGSLSVGPDGRVYPCQRLHHSKFALGNVIHGVVNRERRDRLADHRPGTCFSCEAKCTPCYASNYEAGGDIDDIPEDECRFQRVLLAAAATLGTHSPL